MLKLRERVFRNSIDTFVPMNRYTQQAKSIQNNMSHTAMKGFRSQALPVYKALVSEFTLFDGWFALIVASIEPNRLYIQFATFHGVGSNNVTKLIKEYPQNTIFKSITYFGLDC